MHITSELVVRFLSILIPAGSVGGFILHFFASGNTLIKDRRLDKNFLYYKIDVLEKEIRYKNDLAVAIELRLNRICWCWDSNCALILTIIDALERGETIPPIILRTLKQCKQSKDMISDITIPEPPDMPNTPLTQQQFEHDSPEKER